MKKLLLLLSLFTLSIIAGPPEFVPPQGNLAGYIKVKADGLFCGSMEIKPLEGKNVSLMLFNYTRDEVRSKESVERQANEMYTPASQGSNFYKDKSGLLSQIDDLEAWKKKFVHEHQIEMSEQRVFGGGRKKREKPTSIKLPSEGIKVKYDYYGGGHPDVFYKIHVVDSDGFIVTNPWEYVTIRSIKHNVPCVGILAPEEKYEPLMMDEG